MGDALVKLPRAERERHLWDVVYNESMVQTADPDVARKDADQFVRWMRDGYGVTHKPLGARVAARVWSARFTALGVLGVLLAVAAASLFVLWVVRHNDRDFAGYGPSKVPGHAADAIQAYYGENDAPTNLRLVGQQHSAVFGRAAWKVTYRTRTGRTVCAWVWDNADAPSGLSSEHKVAEGADCA